VITEGEGVAVGGMLMNVETGQEKGALEKGLSIRNFLDEAMVWWIYIACLLAGPASLFLTPPLVTIGISLSAIICMIVAPFGGFVSIPMLVIALWPLAIAVGRLT